MSLKKAYIIVVLILLVDQISKIYIKTHFFINEEIKVFGLDWFRIHFIENEGMAMGARLNSLLPFLDDYTAKLSLTLFRIIAVFGIGYWLISTLKKNKSNLLKITLCLIFASVFYGQLFSSSYGQVAAFWPEAGYAPLLFGNVVDMLQFPITTWTWPEWLPFIGGQSFTFFEYVFNFADAYISTGVLILIFFTIL